ncbi:YicC/YloC family endoribonuclease [Pontibacillus yanchengensis]|uniref:Stress-induced protein n=1 Tax=Pontibacillus yanchengensis Y32 TaxID=1385514 RepID=A0A0A2TEH1_9BACI|nr:YicC/YloC family endoribonuclease [Pontibacillus yanchengensis]KGP73934.1 hypothetical protein N782_18690 [Pontibacillus yanchengensis Y32]
MVKSMTGYGSSVNVSEEQETEITVEIRTVNHRFLDFSTKMPRSLMYLEDRMKKEIQQSFHRGRVDVYVTIEGNGFTKRNLQMDYELMDQFIHEMKLAKSRYQLAGDIDVNTLITFQELFSVQEKDEGYDKIEHEIMSALQEAKTKVLDMRVQEGIALQEDMKTRLDQIRIIISELEARRHIVIDSSRDRIKQRMTEYINEELKEDGSRILQEVALLAEKGDITEEVTRLGSHLDQFFDKLTSNEAIGRQLDFIVQEMHREVNTIGSKSNDTQISEWVVQLKSEIEKIKEQVQNVE